MGESEEMKRDTAIKQGELQGSIKMIRCISSRGKKSIHFYRPNWQEKKDVEIIDEDISDVSIFLDDNGYTETYLGYSEHYCGMGSLDLEVFQLILVIAVNISRSQENFLECWDKPKDFLRQFESQLKQVAPKLAFFDSITKKPY